MVHDLVEILIRWSEVRVGQGRLELQWSAITPGKDDNRTRLSSSTETDIVSYKYSGVKLGDNVTTKSYNHVLSLSYPSKKGGQENSAG
jgi:hypothetical protein